MSNYKVISCASFGASGSGVITDYLSEFDNIYNPGDYEFRFLQDFCGVTTLEDSLVHSHHRLNSDTAIKLFLKYVDYQCGDVFNKRYNRFFKGQFGEISKQFIEELCEVTWDGYWEQYQVMELPLITLFKYKIYPRLKRFFSYNKKYIAHYVPKQDMYFSNPSYDEFCDIVKKYINRLCEVLDPSNEKEYIYFDQLLPPVNINRYFSYFDSLHVIVVDRDPRDYYIENVLRWGEGWVPKDVDKYIELYKGLRKKIDISSDNVNILRIQFEDTIYKYDEFSSKINNFLKLSKNNHVQEFNYFNPESSAKNTQLWNKYKECNKSILKIEKELKDYLYDF